MTSVCSIFMSEYDSIGFWHASEITESKDVRNGYTLYILAALGALTLSKYCTFLLVFAHLCKIWRVYAALSWVIMIWSVFDTHLNVQNRKMYAMVTLCTFLLRLVLWRCQNTAHFYWCLHTFVKYDECMQHFHEWVWFDRFLTRIWNYRIERCTQWLHSVHSCCAWCSDVVKILHISIGVCTPL